MLQCTVYLRKRSYVESRVKDFEEEEKLEPPPQDDQPVGADKMPGIARVILHSGDPEQEHIGCQWARRILAFPDPQIGLVFKSGILPKCFELMTTSTNPETQCEVAWIITTIAVGERGGSKYVKKLIKLGALDHLLQLIHSENFTVLDYAVQALANITITRDGPRARDLVISSQRTIHRLVDLALAENTPGILLVRIAVMFFAWYRCWKKTPTQTLKEALLPAVIRLINLNDEHSLSIAASCGVLDYLTRLTPGSGLQEKIDVLKFDGILDRLFHLLDSPHRNTFSHCLCTIGNILRGTTEEEADFVLNAGPLIQILGRLMESNQTLVVRNAALVTSIITAGTRDQLNRVVEGGLVPILLKVAQDGAREAKQYAVFAITNIANSCTQNHIEYMCQNDVIPIICSAFTFKYKSSKDRLVGAMQALARILILASEEDGRDGEKIRKYRESVVECGGLVSMEQLQIDHDKDKVKRNSDVYKVARAILGNFFREDEDEDADVKAAKMQKLD